MYFRRIAAGVTVLLMLAGCGTAAPAGSTTPTGTPATVATPSAPAATPSAAASPPASAPGASQPGFVGDPDLAAKFPTQVAGNPVTNVTTAKLVDFFTAFGTPADQIEKTRQALAGVGIDMNTVIIGNANATVAGKLVSFSAVRVPGLDAAKLIPISAELNRSNPTDKLTQETSGGKSVSVLRSEGGYASSWMYASGEILWSVNTSNDKEAAAVFSALP